MADSYIETLIWRFPRLEMSIRTLHRDDAEFRSICEKMELAEIARQRCSDMPDRADEYRQIYDRLQDEFLDHLTRKTREAFFRPLQQGMKDDGRSS